MLKAIRDIGEKEAVKEKEDKGKKDERLYDKIEADKVIIIKFNKEGKIEFNEEDKNVVGEDFKKDFIEKYFYKKAKSNNPPTYTPTLPLNKKEVGKTVNNLKKVLKKIADNLEKEKVLLSNIVDSLDKLEIEKIEKEIEKIEKEKALLSNIIDSLNKLKIKEIEKKINSNKEKLLLTIKIGESYIGEIPLFKEAVKRFVSEEGEKSRSIGLCSICLKDNVEVSGDISPFKFYTIDKPGYVAGGFKKEISYKNFPICYECRDYMRIGRERIEKDLKFSLLGLPYYIIPEFTARNIEDIDNEIFNILFNTEYRTTILSKRERKILMADEREILDLLSEKGDFLILNFLFLEKSNSSEKIHLYMQGIYPSRLKELFKIKGYTEELLDLKDFRYTTIGKFFFEDGSQKYFLEIIDKTFRGLRIEDKFIIPFLNARVRSAILNNENYIKEIQDAYAVYLFIKMAGKEVSMENLKTQSLEEFIDSLPTLDTSTKKYLFLMGVLTEKILNIQRKQLEGNKPFIKKLKSLKMNKEDIKELLPALRIKLEEYDNFDYMSRKIFELASEYIAKEDNLNRMSVTEINFYFSIGMGMYNKVANIFYSNSKKEEGNGEQT
ncbi:MAG: TIGR02556 family CRISPR-associated protein [Caldimicrobium thiodismutans]